MNPGQGKLAASKLAKLQAECDAWNAEHVIGTHVVLTRDDNVQLRTRTRSEAQVLSGHSAVIWLDGVSGCYLLNRVRAVPETDCESEP